MMLASLDACGPRVRGGEAGVVGVRVAKASGGMGHACIRAGQRWAHAWKEAAGAAKRGEARQSNQQSPLGSKSATASTMTSVTETIIRRNAAPWAFFADSKYETKSMA